MKMKWINSIDIIKTIVQLFINWLSLDHMISQLIYGKGLIWDEKEINFVLAGDVRDNNQKFNYDWNISESGKISFVSS